MSPAGSKVERSAAGEREMVFTRVFDAPRALVWKAWTDPNHVPAWWGPRGFRTTIHAMDVRPGGVWRFTMHGPDGRDYKNFVTYTEVAAPERLKYRHGGQGEDEPVHFDAEILFEEVGQKTRVTLRMICPTAAMKAEMAKYGAADGAVQTLDRLGDHLAEVGGGDGAGREFVITRHFAAPREVVYRAWTERDRLAKWFGPKGVTIPKCTLDLRPGGVFHYCMRGPDGKDMWGRWVFREIVPGDRLVFVVSFSDESGGITRAPFDESWPREMLSVVTFEPHAGLSGGTVVTVRWSALNATPAEQKTFDAGIEGMTRGWTGTFEQLEGYLRAAK